MSNISPFTFIAWKEDVNGLIVGTKDASIGYMELLGVDGVQAEDIIEYAKEQKGESAWEKDIAANFPTYVAALAAKAGKPCFVTTKKANVEYADISTGEVMELSIDAFAESYNEAVRVAEARSAHTMPNNANGGDDEYESVDDDDDGSHGDDPASQAYMRKRQFIDMISTQLETAASIAADLDLTLDEIMQAYQAAAGDHKVPVSTDECFAIAEKDEALRTYLSNQQRGAAGGANCPQQ